jgi:hypothetical protein
MTIFGKTLGEYLRFQMVFLIAILVVGLLRLTLSLVGAPDSTSKWFSMTAITVIGWLYYSIVVYTSGFGSYKQLLPLLVIQSLVTQAIAILGIAIAIFTGHDNIFSVPEFSGPYEGAGRSWVHAGGHLLFGVVLISLIWWLVGSGIMFLTKKIAPRGKGAISSSAT